MQNLQIVPTSDGSNTIYNTTVGENYHSKHGALQESLHVFVGNGITYFLEKNESAKQVSILEVGFGTGLNFLLSAQHCFNTHIALNYTGIEAFPLNLSLLTNTGYQQYIEPEFWQTFINSYPQALLSAAALPKNITLQIAHSLLLNYQSLQQFDIIYFDAFANIHQPEMWTVESISHTIKFLKPGGLFVTYAITGELKRMLVALGLHIEKLPGAAKKREMLRAFKTK